MSVKDLTLLKADHTRHICITIPELPIASCLVALYDWGCVHFHWLATYSGRLSSW